MDLAGRQGLEAILFLADEPVAAVDLAEVLEVDVAEVESEIEALAARYEHERRGIEIRRAAGGWRMYSASGARGVLERWALSGRTGRLTQAALETLAVIAYKQPISRQDVGDIRGVNADAAVRNLVARGLVAEVGRDEGPGQAVLYGTTSLFLERIGVDRLDELPPLTDFLPESPAPDEPEHGAIRQARQRLAEAGGPLRPGPGAGAEADEEALPAPSPAQPDDATDGMDDLTDRLDQAARSAVDRLRQAVSAAEEDAEPDPGPDDRVEPGREDDPRAVDRADG